MELIKSELAKIGDIIKRTIIKLRLESKYRKIVMLIPILYILFFSIYTSSLHYTFHTTAGDLGQNTQKFWTTIHQGTPLETTLAISPNNPTGSYLGAHFAAVLFLIVPLYFIYQSPYTLLIIKAFFIGISILVLSKIAEKKLKDQKLVLVVVLAYIFNPHLLGAQMFDFQEQAFLPFFIFSVYYFYLRKQYVISMLFITLSLLTSEYMPFLIIPFLAALFLEDHTLLECFNLKTIKDEIKSRRGHFLLCSAAMCLVLFFIAHLVMGMFNVYVSEVVPTNFYAIELPSTTPFGIIIYLSTHPHTLLKALSYDLFNKFTGLISFLTPMLFLPLMDPVGLFPLIPYCANAWISQYPLYYRMSAHYSLYILPFCFIAVVKMLQKISDNFSERQLQRRSKRIILTILLIACSISYVGSWTNFNHVQYPTFDEHTEKLYQILKMIPENASVLTQNNLFPHVANRPNAYLAYDDGFNRYFPNLLKAKGDLAVDYILYDLKSTAWGINWARYASPIIPYTAAKVKDGEYGLFVYNDGIYLFKKEFSGDPLVVEFREVYNFEHLILWSGSIKEDVTSKSGKVLVHSPDDQEEVFWYGPYIGLPPGKYKVTFRIKTQFNRENDTKIITLAAYHQKGLEVLAEKTVKSADLISGVWQNVTLSFTVENFVEDAEFAGLKPSNSSIIELDYILVELVGNITG